MDVIYIILLYIFYLDYIPNNNKNIYTNICSNKSNANGEAKGKKSDHLIGSLSGNEFKYSFDYSSISYGKSSFFGLPNTATIFSIYS